MSFFADERHLLDRTEVNLDGENYVREEIELLCPVCVTLTVAVVTMDHVVYYQHTEAPTDQPYCEMRLDDIPDPVKDPHFYNLIKGDPQ